MDVVCRVLLVGQMGLTCVERGFCPVSRLIHDGLAAGDAAC